MGFEIPVYLKTKDTERPTDPEFYWIASNGNFLCRNHELFESAVEVHKVNGEYISGTQIMMKEALATCVEQMKLAQDAVKPSVIVKHTDFDLAIKQAEHLKALAHGKEEVTSKFPMIPKEMMEQIVGFFRKVYERHDAEAIVLLLWDKKEKRYVLEVPKQWTTYYTSSWSGKRHTSDNIKYDMPKKMPVNCYPCATIHSHMNHTAYASWTDRKDVEHMDGLHITIGKIASEALDFYLELQVDGEHWELDRKGLAPYNLIPATEVPDEWMQKFSLEPDEWEKKDIAAGKLSGSGRIAGKDGCYILVNGEWVWKEDDYSDYMRGMPYTME